MDSKFLYLVGKKVMFFGIGFVRKEREELKSIHYTGVIAKSRLS